MMANPTINQHTNHHGTRPNYRSVRVRRHTKDQMKIYYCKFDYYNETQGRFCFQHANISSSSFHTEPIILRGMVQIRNCAKAVKVQPKVQIQHCDQIVCIKRKVQKVVNCAKDQMPVWSKGASILNLKCNKLQMLNAIEQQPQQQQQLQQSTKSKTKLKQQQSKNYMKKNNNNNQHTYYKLELHEYIYT